MKLFLLSTRLIDQNPPHCFGCSREKAVLQKHGVPKDQIFCDKISGARSERPGLTRCLAELGRGDTRIVWRLDRLGRSMRLLVAKIEELRGQGIGFRSLSDGVIDTTIPSGELLFNRFSALAQFERRLIQDRTNASLSAARARGRRGGRPRLWAMAPKVVLAQRLFRDKAVSTDDIGETLKISKSTLY